MTIASAPILFVGSLLTCFFFSSSILRNASSAANRRARAASSSASVRTKVFVTSFFLLCFDGEKQMSNGDAHSCWVFQAEWTITLLCLQRQLKQLRVASA